MKDSEEGDNQNKITIHVNDPAPHTAPSHYLALAPCAHGMHQWAWTNSGRVECYRCGVRK